MKNLKHYQREKSGWACLVIVESANILWLYYNIYLIYTGIPWEIKNPSAERDNITASDDGRYCANLSGRGGGRESIFFSLPPLRHLITRCCHSSNPTVKTFPDAEIRCGRRRFAVTKYNNYYHIKQIWVRLGGTHRTIY